MFKPRLILITVLVLLGNAAWPHGGGMDSLGCHNDRTAGGYHCHRGELAGQLFASKAEAQKALAGIRNQDASLAPSMTAPSRSAADQQAFYRGVRIAPENRCAPYDRDDYSYPQSVELLIIDRQGGLYSPYTGRCFATRRETDIEHMVATSEAHDSGLCAATNTAKRRFASDLANLTLASPGLNRREKRAKDAAEWLPEKNTCWFVNRTLEVRRKYSLTIDPKEARAVEEILEQCESTEHQRPECP